MNVWVPLLSQFVALHPTFPLFMQHNAALFLQGRGEGTSDKVPLLFSCAFFIACVPSDFQSLQCTASKIWSPLHVSCERREGGKFDLEPQCKKIVGAYYYDSRSG
mmetsp:Transcript_98269/g.204961  ORF Transcript_98269/g.204961 Transcript_98269/m.204961 type:complete len:105 (+) Transcript_98269:50-364(+)